MTIGRGVAVTRSEHTEGSRGKEMTPEQPGARQRQHFLQLTEEMRMIVLGIGGERERQQYFRWN